MTLGEGIWGSGDSGILMPSLGPRYLHSRESFYHILILLRPGHSVDAHEWLLLGRGTEKLCSQPWYAHVVSPKTVSLLQNKSHSCSPLGNLKMATGRQGSLLLGHKTKVGADATAEHQCEPRGGRLVSRWGERQRHLDARLVTRDMKGPHSTHVY